MADVAWRVSPVATALTFSALELERPRFVSAAHLELISDAIVDGVAGDGPRWIIITMPPRHGKSTLVTLRTPQWFLSNNPWLTVGMCGYGGEFADDWGRRVRNGLDLHEEKIGFKLAADSKKANWWHTTEGGGMWTAGINGQITGKGADLLVIDDPIKSSLEANSPTYRDRVWTWWQNDALSRTYPHSVIIVVMTRWHSDDLVGRLLSTEYSGDPSRWRVINLPAIWDKDVPDEIGRKKGDALWPNGPHKYTAEWLMADRQGSMDDAGWQSLFQQTPLNQTGVGACYRSFDETVHVRDLVRDDQTQLFWSLDFNVDPMCSAYGQIKEMAGTSLHDILTSKKLTTMEVLGEICLPNSRTVEACAEFEARYYKINRGKKPEVWVYGDATANCRDTRGTQSDWEIIGQFFRSAGIPFRDMVRTSNPPVRDRVNAMNAALKSANGIVGLFIDPSCKELRKDFKEVRWKRDSSGNASNNLDNSDPKRTHISDALGYAVITKFALTGFAGERSGLLQ